MGSLFQARLYGRFIKDHPQRNFRELIKAPIFLEAVLAIETMQEPQSNLNEKEGPSILRDDFSSRTDLSNFTSIAPETGQMKQAEFSCIEIKNPIPAPVHSISWVRFKFRSQL